ncbi:MAG TPA: hypothetical protein VKF40_19245, partial [Burkholderiales bacterium]|nr:hypothetical protein [Burkholderiales bacterium]
DHEQHGEHVKNGHAARAVAGAIHGQSVSSSRARAHPGRRNANSPKRASWDSLSSQSCAPHRLQRNSSASVPVSGGVAGEATVASADVSVQP